MPRIPPTLLLLLALAYSAHAQVDTEFWFAPPEVTSGHGDRPLYLRISTLDQSAMVNVTQPGCGNTHIATANIPAHTTHTIYLTGQITNLETTLPATVMRTGIRITASSPITAYYEIGAPFNADIFALKGRNALGNRFVIPAQNFYNNSADYSPRPSSSFDIVATQNNTVVKVRPTRPLVGHMSDSLITIKLNAGETYSLRKPTLLATDNPAGTRVDSNKPIAITITDDSVINGGCRDVLGDQLVPVEVAGKEYVVLKGFLNTPEYLFITATEDDTQVFVGGSGSSSKVLAAGEIYRHPVTEKSTYITATRTIYVFHVTGFGCEMGLAILPSINCKGSPQIGFSRTTDEFFGLNVLVRREGIASFTLNGSAALVPASVFTPVPGTSDEWYTAQLSFGTHQIAVGHASLIANSNSSFQVGIINGNASSTCRYGYFSSFSTLFIGDDLDICEGAVATLDAGPGKESYLWNNGATSQQIQVDAPGEYWVKVVRESCVLYDTISVSVKKGHVDIGPDVEVCRGDTALIDGKENFSWLWSDGSTGQFLSTSTQGTYSVSVFDCTGCLASDTVRVILKDLPTADLGPDVLKCKTDEVALDATFDDASYLWSDGITTATRNVLKEGPLWVKVTENGCHATDTLLIENRPGPPQDSIYGTPSVCPYVQDVNYRVDGLSGYSYQWFVEGGSIRSNEGPTITVDWFAADVSAKVRVLVTDTEGCRGDTLNYPVRINVILLPEIPEGPDTLCINQAQHIVYTTPHTSGSVYQWNISGGVINSGQGSSQADVDWVEGLNRLWIEETSITIDTVCQGVSEELLVYVFRDTTDIRMNFVSVDTASGTQVVINWNLDVGNPVRSEELSLFRRQQGPTQWQLLETMSSGANTYQDAPGLFPDGIFEYYLSLTNPCDELLQTAVHNNMFLNGMADTLSGLISLHWNHYTGWPEGVAHYEIWRKTDNEPGYRFVSEVANHENVFSRNMAQDAFDHQYVIRARQKNGQHESWSTPLTFGFRHAVKIPNIITPNGDGYNEYFHISKIELYRTSELRILDRWGKEVFYRVNYQNNWNGDGLSAGVYFYVLDLRRNNQVYKGTLTIF